MKTGTANLPLHGGQCPAWLFVHMKALCAAIVEVIIEDAGPQEVLQRLSNPYWFQALGCVVGFDWHSSGVTTTVCGALKEGLREIGPRAGLFFAGGKGKVSRQTPREIENWADKYPVIEPKRLIYASKMAAKIDSAAVQDGYQLYHHCLVFTSQGDWTVIQQGMNEAAKQARRYHWFSPAVQSFTCEPHAAICCDTSQETLNLVAQENQTLQTVATDLLRLPPEQTLRELRLLEEKAPALTLPRVHAIPRTAYLNRALQAAYDTQPGSFEEVLGIPGVGPGTLRALSLVAEVAFGVEASYRDPVRYAFAHGGKDGYPFPVNEKDIENSYQTLNRALRKARAGRKEQVDALRKLARWHSEAVQVQASPSAAVSTGKTCPPPTRVRVEPARLVQPRLFD
jgi:hypothetical protein